MPCTSAPALRSANAFSVKGPLLPFLKKFNAPLIPRPGVGVLLLS